MKWCQDGVLRNRADIKNCFEKTTGPCFYRNYALGASNNIYPEKGMTVNTGETRRDNTCKDVYANLLQVKNRLPCVMPALDLFPKYLHCRVIKFTVLQRIQYSSTINQDSGSVAKQGLLLLNQHEWLACKLSPKKT
jgi:hypothetical protein